jgi:branched-chain amino acid transport system ATP-binding protein
MLEIAHLTGGWGPTTVIEDVSLSVAAGECVAIVGRNGVGKSTLLEIVAGRAQQKAGAIRLAGADISRLSTYQRAKAGLGYVPQNREVFPSLTVREHFAVAGRPGRWTEAEVLNLLPRLGQRMDNLGRQLSGGEQQMLAIARALLGNPRLILMDEPSEGIAPVIVEQLIAVLKEIIADGSLSLLLIEQRTDIALQLSTRFAIMDRGRISYRAESSAFSAGTQGLPELMGLTH